MLLVTIVNSRKVRKRKALSISSSLENNYSVAVCPIYSFLYTSTSHKDNIFWEVDLFLTVRLYCMPMKEKNIEVSQNLTPVVNLIYESATYNCSPVDSTLRSTVVRILRELKLMHGPWSRKLKFNSSFLLACFKRL